MATQNCDHLFKLIMVGDSQVGKTSLAFRFTDNVFSQGQKSTIDLDFKIKTMEIDGKKIQLQIWDTGGPERLQSLESNFFKAKESFQSHGHGFYRGADGVILVFDITNTRSFENIYLWLSEINEQAPRDVKTMILGNKCDMIENRQVAKDRGETIAKNHNSLYVETSSKSGTNVQQAFTDLVQSIIDVKQPARSDQKQKNTNKAKARICKIL